jgi:hypothetical protein
MKWNFEFLWVRPCMNTLYHNRASKNSYFSPTISIFAPDSRIGNRLNDWRRIILPSGLLKVSGECLTSRRTADTFKDKNNVTGDSTPGIVPCKFTLSLSKGTLVLLQLHAAGFTQRTRRSKDRKDGCTIANNKKVTD